jgi:DNA oxidative demethylase
MTLDLFPFASDESHRQDYLCAGAVVLRAFALSRAPVLLASVGDIARASPFRHMVTPGGFRMSVAMTNTGEKGWVTDRTGYRYAETDPESGEPWPRMPAEFLRLASEAAATAGFEGFKPDSCLINRYEPGARLTLHQDKDERDYSHPIVSVSLGAPAVFLFGGLKRNDRAKRVPLAHGDVAVWGGPARLYYHGVATLKEGRHELAGAQRINLTFRKAG